MSLSETSSNANPSVTPFKMKSETTRKTVVYQSSDLPSGVKIHYASAGCSAAPYILLLHGYPSSANQYRKLIPVLAENYHVVAPDLPGFGLTITPSGYQHTFANMASVICDFLSQQYITKTAVYIFDYGAPTAFRIALARPDLFPAIITQNGNAFEEGLGPFWDPLKAWWKTGDRYNQIRSTLRDVVGDIESTKHQYYDGVPADLVEYIDPSSYTLDYLQNLLPDDKREIQLDLFWDYQNNIKLYPEFQRWMLEKQVPILAVWGKNDPIFIPPGAEAFAKARETNSANKVEVVLLDGGDFLLETHLEEVSERIQKFLQLYA
jgi:pimeloyl-ACP methyl ester carboxylesterase